MKSRLFKTALIAMTTLLLSSCDFSFITSSKSGTSTRASTLPPSGDGYYKATSVTKDVSWEILGQFNADPVLPSTGVRDVLVCPIEFTNYSFTTSRLKDINTVFNGESSDTNYWESLRSYYYKSSYGKLTMNFEIADVTKMNKTPKEFYDYCEEKYDTSDSYISCGVQECMQAAVKAYKTKNGSSSTKKFDSNNDGIIDAVLMVYSCPDAGSSSAISKIDPNYDIYWAFKYSDFSVTKGNTSSPIGLTYFWCSYDFFYEGIKEGSGVDCHTLVHEMGHVLGSDDLYNAYGTGTDISEPSGQNIMMACNVCDHDIFSKFAFGWIDPIVITGNSTVTIKPASTSSTDNCIILADNWNGTIFDEFIILELYTPLGLNKKDAETEYHPQAGYRGLTGTGIRAYHVDNRLCKVTGWNDKGGYISNAFLTDAETRNIKNDSSMSYYYYPACSNSKTYDASFISGKGYELCQIIQAGKTNTTKSGAASTNSDLFKTNSSFSLSSYSAFFPNGSKFNNGDSLSYSFKVNSVSSTEATITFTKA